MSRPIFMALFVSLLLLMGGVLLLVGCTPDGGGTAYPDLVPAKAPGSNSQYASVDTEGKLVFYVENQGDADAPVTTTTIRVLDTDDTYVLWTPAVAAGATVETEEHLARPDCGGGDCHLQIIVNSNGASGEPLLYSYNDVATWTLIS